MTTTYTRRWNTDALQSLLEQIKSLNNKGIIRERAWAAGRPLAKMGRRMHEKAREAIAYVDLQIMYGRLGSDCKEVEKLKHELKHEAKLLSGRLGLASSAKDDVQYPIPTVPSGDKISFFESGSSLLPAGLLDSPVTYDDSVVGTPIKSPDFGKVVETVAWPRSAKKGGSRKKHQSRLFTELFYKRAAEWSQNPPLDSHGLKNQAPQRAALVEQTVKTPRNPNAREKATMNSFFPGARVMTDGLNHESCNGTGTY